MAVFYVTMKISEEENPMRAYIQTNNNGDFYNVNAFIANEGFSSLGWETIKFLIYERSRIIAPKAY